MLPGWICTSSPFSPSRQCFGSSRSHLHPSASLPRNESWKSTLGVSAAAAAFMIDPVRITSRWNPWYDLAAVVMKVNDGRFLWGRNHVSHVKPGVSGMLHIALTGSPMFGSFKRKPTAAQPPVNIRDTLFGDLPLDAW